MRGSNSERGSILITVALIIGILIMFLALVVDLGMGFIERRRIQSVADAAALAGGQVMVNNLDNDKILAAVREYAMVQNPPASNETRYDPTDPSDVTVTWIGGAQDGEPIAAGGTPPAGVTGIQVTVKGDTPTFFARLLGVDKVTAVASGGSGYAPLEVMLVIDRSISMAFYSCNWERYFAAAQPCQNHIPAVTSELERIKYVYYRCNGVDAPISMGDLYDCRGMWVTPPTPAGPTPVATPAPQCYWVDHFTDPEQNITPVPGAVMAPVPTECAVSGVANQADCEACRGAIVTPLHPMTELKTAASHFVGLVEAQLASTYLHMGLATYSDYGTLDAALTDDLDDVRAAIATTEPDHNTNCEEGLYKARNELTTNGRGDAVKAIVFLTDGAANLYSNCYLPRFCEATAKSRAIAEAHAAQDNRIRVYTIGLGDGADGDMLQQMANDVDLSNGDYTGAYVHASDATQLDAAYAQIFAMIKQLRLVK